jgi:hypothetical protein
MLTAVTAAPYLRNSKKVTVVEYFLSRTSNIVMLEAAPSNVRLPATVLAIAKTSQAFSSAPTWVRKIEKRLTKGTLLRTWLRASESAVMARRSAAVPW